MSEDTQPKIYLAFYKPNSTTKNKWWHYMIKFVDGGFFTHVELAIESEEKPGYFECYSSSHSDDGVRKKMMKLKSNHWVLIELDSTRYKSEFIKFRFDRLKGKKYDYVGLLSTKFSWFPHQKDKWFCSELCAYLLSLHNPNSYGLRKLYEYTKLQ